MSEDPSQYGSPIFQGPHSPKDIQACRETVLKQHPLPWTDTFTRDKDTQTFDANGHEVPHLTLSRLAVAFLTQQ